MRQTAARRESGWRAGGAPWCAGRAGRRARSAVPAASSGTWRHSHPPPHLSQQQHASTLVPHAPPSSHTSALPGSSTHHTHTHQPPHSPTRLGLVVAVVDEPVAHSPACLLQHWVVHPHLQRPGARVSRRSRGCLWQVASGRDSPSPSWLEWPGHHPPGRRLWRQGSRRTRAQPAAPAWLLTAAAGSSCSREPSQACAGRSRHTGSTTARVSLPPRPAGSRAAQAAAGTIALPLRRQAVQPGAAQRSAATAEAAAAGPLTLDFHFLAAALPARRSNSPGRTTAPLSRPDRMVILLALASYLPAWGWTHGCSESRALRGPAAAGRAGGGAGWGS
jgi:hypothetical protein